MISMNTSRNSLILCVQLVATLLCTHSTYVVAAQTISEKPVIEQTACRVSSAKAI